MSNGMILTVGSGPDDLHNHTGVGKGQRNATLCRLVGVHLARGEGVEQIESLASAWGEKCDPPMLERDVLRTVRSLATKHERQQQQPHSPLDDESDDVDDGDGVLQADDLIPSVIIVAGDADGGQRAAVSEPYPTLHADALHGLAGSIVQAIEPETEADPAGVLLSLLVGFGTAVGRSPYFCVGPDRHHANLFALLVGDTAARKGMAWGIAKNLLGRADPTWAAQCLVSGLGSGEGLVERVRDAVQEYDPESQSFLTTQPAATDKRLLVQEEEFASVLKLTRRDGNTLSSLLRLGWDGKPLEVLNRKKNALRATEAHVGILGLITPDELSHCLKGSSEAVNGFSNRFLFALVRRQRLLPHGGDVKVLDSFVEPVTVALAKGKNLTELRRSADADRLWEDQYPCLSESHAGAYGKAVERACPQVMRLALIYALLDGSSVIEPVHLRAGLAVWAYCNAWRG